MEIPQSVLDALNYDDPDKLDVKKIQEKNQKRTDAIQHRQYKRMRKKQKQLNKEIRELIKQPVIRYTDIVEIQEKYGKA